MFKSLKLYQLAKIILLVEKEGLSKVRFAKIIYFVHKELVRLEAMNRNELQYIRMPLGPVPDGFMKLDAYPGIKVEIKPSGLSYNSAIYKLAWPSGFSIKRNALFIKIEEILAKLHRISTSDLVEISHKEPSWLRHKNSELYFISSEDMNNPFPVASRQAKLDENQSIQASLIKGMLEDIINESTDLEYPRNA